MTAKDWKNCFSDRDESGLSVSAWCKKRGIRPNQYYYWKKRLENDGKGLESSKFVRIGVSEGMELWVGEKVRVKVPGNFDSATLKRLLEALGC